MSALANNYNRKKIAFSKGKGSFLYSTNRSKYLDFVQGIAVNSLGHAHPKLVAALNKQSKKVWHVSNAFQIPEGEKLAKKLTQHTFADYVLFQNSGPENIIELNEWVENQFKNHPFLQLEYFTIADEKSLKPINIKEFDKKYRAFIAVFAGNIRLIDNIQLKN